MSALYRRIQLAQRRLTRLQQDRKVPQLRLDQLANCAPMGTAADGDTVVYNRAAGQYEPGQAGGAGSGAAFFRVEMPWFAPGNTTVGAGNGIFFANCSDIYTEGATPGVPTGFFWLLNDVAGDTLYQFGMAWIAKLNPGSYAGLPVFVSPSFTGVGATMRVRVFQWGLTNASATQVRTFSGPGGGFPMPPFYRWYSAAGDWSLEATLGSDLSLTGNGITSAGGGTYMCGMTGWIEYYGCLFT